ncbi:MAG: hypothetical protein OEW08_09835 [Gammaproteobacteria bacterium]|nr:hypothetical protein [Gammaproteobacteria bacterium]
MKKLPHGIENLTGIRKWIKEIACTPTYLGSALIAIKYTGDNFLISTLVFLCFLMISHHLYEYLFLNFDTSGKKKKLFFFVFAQIFFWVLIILLLP